MSPRDPDASTEGPEEPSLQDNNNAATGNNNDEPLELKATAAMCHHCFDTLIVELKAGMRQHRRWTTRSSSSSTTTTTTTTDSTATSGVSENNNNNNQVVLPDFVDSLPSQTVECPLFVTWDKRRHHHRRHSRRQHHKNNKNDNDDEDASLFELRGCIGTLAPKPLVSSIGEYAVISALSDRRFSPVSFPELPKLRVAVSLLVQYEECRHWQDWSVGIHGILIRWTDCATGVEFSATYLPEVALDQGWDQETTVRSLVRKAGYHGTVSDDLLREIQCTRYQSSKHCLTYDEYVLHRGGHDPVRTSNASGLMGGAAAAAAAAGHADYDEAAASSSNCSIM